VRRIFALNRGKRRGGVGECCVMRNLTICNIIRVITSGHVARMGEMRTVYEILIDKYKGNLDLGGKIILKCSLQDMD
jgi:hypothetical protein